MNICLGDIVERLIHYTTFGFGKKGAEKIAHLLGFESCGCSERQQKLNKIFNCNKGIKI